MGSILAADFGSVTTRVVLFDIVDGEYRLVARRDTLTTAAPPWDDVTIGLKRILREMGSAMNRTFADSKGSIITPEGADRSGVDVFVTTASVGRPLRTLLIGLLPEGSLRSAMRAVSSAYIEVVRTISLLDVPTEEEQLNAVLLARPDMIFIAGGTDGGPRKPLLKLAVGIRLALLITDPAFRPVVVYAGNQDVVADIQAMFGELTQVFVAGNVTPREGVESLESAIVEIGKAYDVFKERYGDGFETLSTTSATGVLPTAQSYTLLAEFMARDGAGNVVAVDMGSASTTLVGVFNNRVYSRVTPQYGLGHSAVAMYESIGAEAVRAWLPYNISLDDLQHYMLNKMLRPSSIPATLRDVYMEHALLRGGLRHLLRDALSQWADLEAADLLPPVDTIIAGGAGLTRTGKPAYNLLLIVDALQPRGVTRVYADAYGIVPALGAMARTNPLATVQVLDAGNLDLLGTVVSLSGQARAERVVARLKLTTQGETLNYELKGGHVVFLPIPQDYTLELDIRCQNGMTLNGRSRQKLTLQGGSAGIMIDGRGRSFDAGRTTEERAKNLPMWLQAATDTPAHEIPAEWLVPVADEAAPAPQPAPASKSRRARSAGKAQAPATTASRLDDDDLMALLEQDEPAPTRTGAAGPLPEQAEAPAGAKGLRQLGRKASAPVDDDELRGLL
jgi:uncharacterized protein (TIGR01319 family)